MKKKLLSAALTVILTGLVGAPSLAIAGGLAARLWSVAVHLEYADGTAYDYVLATGVSTSEVSAILAECGRSHRTGTVVRYHCFPIPE
jgi:adenylylsulfate kinase-like enzyme